MTTLIFPSHHAAIGNSKNMNKTFAGLLVCVMGGFLFGCAYDPISGKDSSTGSEARPNPYIQPQPPPPPRHGPASREVPPLEVESPPWPVNPVYGYRLIPFVLFEGMIRWTAHVGTYRVIVSDDGINWFEHSRTWVLVDNGTIAVMAPTNRYYGLSSP